MQGSLTAHKGARNDSCKSGWTSTALLNCRVWRPHGLVPNEGIPGNKGRASCRSQVWATNLDPCCRGRGLDRQPCKSEGRLKGPKTEVGGSHLPIPPGRPLSAWNASSCEHLVLSLVGAWIYLVRYSKTGTSWVPVSTVLIPEDAFNSALQFYLDFRNES